MFVIFYPTRFYYARFFLAVSLRALEYLSSQHCNYSGMKFEYFYGFMRSSRSQDANNFQRLYFWVCWFEIEFGKAYCFQI